MFKNLSIKFRLVLLTVLLSLVAIVVGAVGLASQNATNAALGTVYNDRLVVLADLSKLLSLMQQNQNTLARAALAAGTDPAPAVAEVEDRIGQVSALWAKYKATYLTEEEKVLAQTFIESRMAYVEQGLRPTLAVLRGHDMAAATALVEDRLNPLYLPAQKNMQALIRLQLDVAKDAYEAALAR
jgi:methyl-accepting chemotaxis protein-1 (serine sensor receptor)